MKSGSSYVFLSLIVIMFNETISFAYRPLGCTRKWGTRALRFLQNYKDEYSS